MNSEFLNNKLDNKILKQIVLKKNFANAYIFYGPEDVGKKDEANKFISHIINKNNFDTKILKKIRENNHPDFLFIEPTYLLKSHFINQSEIDKNNKNKNKPLIRINQIRSINNFLSKVSIEADKKFVVINDAHLLNEASSNCLLKTLEEPSNGIFILITTNIDSILDTIISRCQKIKFSSYSYTDLKGKVIKSEFYEELNNKKYLNLENIIFISNGSPGKLYRNISKLINISESIIMNLVEPTYEYEKIFNISKKINEEIELDTQEVLLDYIQYTWWKETFDINIANRLERIKNNIRNGLNSRLSWEVGLLEIALSQTTN
tara:strand:+ start:2423 stop:3382 length:960 start_codon:yes stop_codon:yes gene_type:complete